MKMITKKKVIIFSGAGFSQQYMKEKRIPLSTKTINELLSCENTFIEKYKDIFKSDVPAGVLNTQKLYSQIWKILKNEKSYSNELYSPNFETVFFVLNHLCQLKDRPFNQKTVGVNSHFSCFLPTIVSSIKNDFDIPFEYYDFYLFQNFLLSYISIFEAKQDDLNKLNKFFRKIMEDKSLRYYTLNYDSLFIDALGLTANNYGGSPFLSTSEMNYGYRLDKLLPTRIMEHSNGNCCFHLHGSVYFVGTTHSCKMLDNKNEALKERQSNGAALLEELNTGEYRIQSEFIVGYDKDKVINLEPFNSMLLRFALDLIDDNTEELIILGYGLGDEHINKLLIKLTAPVRAPFFYDPEVRQSVIESNVSKIKKITVIDLKEDVRDQERFFQHFLTIGRENGEGDILDVYNMLNPPQIEKGIYEYSIPNFTLRFDFNGIDNYIEK
jgi:hypothetical protein